MSERVVHVHIKRLVVDEPLRGQAAQWGTAIERALHAHLTHRPAAETHVPETIAQHVTGSVSKSMPATVPSAERKLP